MNCIRTFLMASILGSMPLTAEPNCQHQSDQFQCVEFVRNYDADTITVNIPNVPPIIGREVSVRVRGVDAAEIKGRNACEKDAAKKAKQFANQILTSAKRIDLRNIARDKYFRILADIVVDGVSFSDLLRNRGMVVDYQGGHKDVQNWCDLDSRKPTPPKVH